MLEMSGRDRCIVSVYERVRMYPEERTRYIGPYRPFARFRCGEITNRLGREDREGYGRIAEAHPYEAALYFAHP